MENNHRTKLIRLGRGLKFFVWLAGVLSTFVAVMRWFVSNVRALLPPTLAAFVPSGGLSIGERLACFGAELVPLIVALYILRMLHRVADTCISGELFGSRVGLIYRRLGRGLVSLGVANGLYTTLISAFLTYSRAAGTMKISLGLSMADLYLMVVGVAIVMLGHVLDEAHRIDHENSLIV